MRYARTHDRLGVVRLSRSCLMSPVYTTVCNKSKLAVTEPHRISLESPSFALLIALLVQDTHSSAKWQTMHLQFQKRSNLTNRSQFVLELNFPISCYLILSNIIPLQSIVENFLQCWREAYCEIVTTGNPPINCYYFKNFFMVTFSDTTRPWLAIQKNYKRERNSLLPGYCEVPVLYHE